jgi:hypothetical protein
MRSGGTSVKYGMKGTVWPSKKVDGSEYNARVKQKDGRGPENA